MFYNIHDLFSVRANVDIGIPPIFLEPEGAADLTFEMKDFAHGIGEDDLYREFGSPSIIRSKIWVKQIEKSPYVRFSDGPYKFRRRLSSSILNFLGCILQLELLRRGRVFLHSSCVSRGEDAILMCAPSETGKSLSAFLLAGQPNFSYLSDDMTITDGEFGYCYPNSPKVHSRLIRDLRLDVTNSQYFSMIFRRKFYDLPFLKYFLFPERISVEDLLGKGKIGKRARISMVCFLEQGSSSIGKIDSDLALRKLEMQQGLMDIDFYRNPFLLEYEYATQKLSLPEKRDVEKKIHREVVENSPCFVVKSDRARFDQLILKQFEKL